MGYGHDTSGQRLAGAVTGVPASGIGRSALDQYEYGTVVGVSATGRYKVFATPFTARPVVTLGNVRSAGSGNAVLFGTANVGSFRARMDRVGSTTLNYFAIGPRG